MVKSWLTPVIIGVCALLVRCYSLPSTAIFSADEEYQATYATTIVNDFHPIWIGVSAADTGFYLGPYFTYFTSLWLYLGSGDPLVTNYVSAAIGSLTAVLIFFIGKQISGTKTGIIASILYSFSPLIVYLDQRYWNPSPSAFVACLLILALLNLKNQKWWLIVIAFCLGSFWHIHLALVPLSFVAIYVVWQSRRRITLPVWVLGAITLLIMLLPLIIFDYYHAYSNLLTPLRLMKQEGRSLNLIANTKLLAETLARTLYLAPGTVSSDEIRPGCLTGIFTTASLPVMLFAFLPLLVFYVRRRTWQDSGLRLIAITSLLMILSFTFYPGEVTGYYALSLFPLYFLIVGVIILPIRIKFFVITAYVVVSILTLVSADTRYGLSAKHNLINGVMSYLGEASFTLSEEGTCHQYGGWRYLFSVYGRKPSTSSADVSLAWLYPSEISSPGDYLVIVAPTGEFSLTNSPLTSIISGGYTAYILHQ